MFCFDKTLYNLKNDSWKIYDYEDFLKYLETDIINFKPGDEKILIQHYILFLKKYIDQLTDKNIKILIPGGGNSYEAEYLHNLGFKNVFVVDISPTALTNLKNRVPDFPKNHLIDIDFFKLNNSFDLILEQTFFCALTPKLRDNYVLKMNQLLRPNGKLVGLLFNIPLNKDRPPFGGTKKNIYLVLRIILKLKSWSFHIIQFQKEQIMNCLLN